jgi:hypothetical protein
MLAFGDEDVSGLDVAVNDAAGMGSVERISDFDPQGQRCLEFQGAARDHVLEGHAIKELHNEEGAPVVLANVMDRADVGMVESGRSLGFATETLERLMVLGQVIGEELQSDEATETGVFGFVDDTHAAAAELLHDSIMRDCLVEQTRSPLPMVSNAKARPEGSQKIRVGR